MIPFNPIYLIGFLAYLVKGLTGFGPAIVFISLGSLVMAPARVVAIAPILDVTAGLILIWKDRSITSFSYWSKLSAPLLLGVLIGALGFRHVSGMMYSTLLGSLIILLGLWFLFRPKQSCYQLRSDQLPSRPERGAIIAAIVSGISGGLFGISGPPLIWYFGKSYPKSLFRKIIVPLFLVEAIGRSIIYLSLGMFHGGDWMLILSLIPALLAGLFIGNHWFNIIPQEKFEKVIGIVLALSGIRLLLS